MKFPRNTRIFRGQLDVAPVACLFFMTALILFLHSHIVFVPGVRLDLHPSTNTNKPSLFIDADDIFHFGDTSMSESGFRKRLKADAEKGRAPTTIIFQADPTASTNAVNEALKLAAEYSIALEPPRMRIALPEAADRPGSKTPSVIVAVNANGQFFFENQLVQKEVDLESRLSRAAAAAREPLTLVLRLDRAVAVDTFVRLSEMARKAGFQDVLLSTREPVKPVSEPVL